MYEREIKGESLASRGGISELVRLYHHLGSISEPMFGYERVSQNATPNKE